MNYDNATNNNETSPKGLPSEIYQFEHAGQNLTCSVTGRPYPTITWFKGRMKGNTLDMDFEELPNNGSDNLQFQDLKVEDTGYYVCKVENRIGSLESSTNVLVLDQRNVSSLSYVGDGEAMRYVSITFGCLISIIMVLGLLLAIKINKDR
ncbi:unnamed protein product, partial [Meganyctiphanes norvegica]